MNFLMKRFGAGAMALVLVLSLFIGALPADVFAATITYSATYNSGTRDEICTTLDGTGASDYYTSSYTFDTLSEQSSTQLLQSLRTLMTSTHTYTASYSNCRDYANRTDCEKEDGRVVLLYTSYSATMDQWNGWNREHVWPQSLGGGNTNGGGADLHHVRPSDAGVNSSRGNKKYGNSNNGTAKYGTDPATGCLGGHYNSTYFEPLDNVKGDVARICLYVYVRWGSAWGADSITEVFESVDVLLEWMAIDPVDTWEMGRNEVVEDIQGNRNVFIDYPEYAWLLFGRDVPEDYNTPSDNGGTAKPECTVHTWIAATCTTPKTCSSCKATEGTTADHQDVNGDNVCDVCTIILSCIHQWATKFNATNHYEECSVCKQTRNQAAHTFANNQCICGYIKPQAPAGSYQKVDLSQTTISEGTYLIAGLSATAANGESYTFMTGTNDGSNRLKGEGLTLNGTTVVTTDNNLLWKFTAVSGGFLIQNASTGKYLYYGTKKENKIYLTDSTSTAGVWKVVSNNNGWTLQEEKSGRQLSANGFGSGTSYLGFAAYETSSSTKRSIDLYAPITSEFIKHPSKAEIVAKKQTVTNSQTIFITDPSVVAPYATGSLTDEFLQSGLTYLNYIRFVAGLPEVTLDEALNLEAQHGAVLLAAIDQLTHYPGKPADMDDEFYNQGYQATTSSNISYRWGYDPFSNIRSSIQGCMDDNSSLGNLTTVGHRRWLLNPALGKVGFGYAESTSDASYIVTKVFDRSGAGCTYDFISWPVAGNHPTDLFNSSNPWSVTLNSSVFQQVSADSVKVTVTRESDGTQWTFDGTTGQPNTTIAPYLTVDNQWYGLPNCIIFHPGTENVDAYQGVYRVNVSGIFYQDGSPAELNYTVDFFDIVSSCPGHNYTPVVTAPTCIDQGYTTYTCTICGDSYVADETAATGIHTYDDDQDVDCNTCGAVREVAPAECEHVWNDGVVTVEPAKTTWGELTFTCDKCSETKTEEIPPLVRFATWNVTLKNNIQVNFIAPAEMFTTYGYTNAYAEITIENKNGGTKTVTVYQEDCEIDEKGRTVFSFTDLAPDMLSNKITAKLYATYNGRVYESTLIEKDVTGYIDNQLNSLKNATDTKNMLLRTLMVDLLNYATAVQEQSEYKAHGLINSILTETEKSWASTQEVTAKKDTNLPKTTFDGELLVWKSVSLSLGDAVVPYFKFECADVSGITIKVECGSSTYEYACDVEEEWLSWIASEGRYRFDFIDLGVTRMREPIYLTAYKDGVAVSHTLTYSVQSYCDGKLTPGSTLNDLCIAMLRYGDAAKAYVNS